ncbi:MAG TPA: hypothetical protein VF679_07670 [Pedobacter sp.]|jgi:hypothetical protein
MGNYLTQQQLHSSINGGKGIEQWLGYYDNGGETILKWLRIYPENNTECTVMYVECYDQGDLEFLDLYAFTVVDPDEPYGLITTFRSVEEALAFSIAEYAALKDRFVGNGMIQEQYQNYLTSK